MKQSGLQFLEVELRRGAEQTTLKHEIDVSWPRINLPFSPVGISAEYTGARIAMWQRAAINPDLIERNDCGQLIVMNTANGSKLFSGQLLEKNPDGRIEDGVIAGERFVFYNRTSDESELWSIPLDGSDKAKQLPIAGDRSGSVFSLSVVASSLIVEFEDRLIFLDAKTLEPIRQITPAKGMIRRPVVAQRKFGPALYGVVVDESMKPVIAERVPWYSPDLFDARRNESVVFEQPESSATDPIPWRPRISSGEIGISVVLNADARSQTAGSADRNPMTPLTARPISQHWTKRITADIRYSDSHGTLLTKPLGTMRFGFADEFLGFLYLSRVSDVVLCAGRRVLILPLPKAKEFSGNDVRLHVAVIPDPEHNILSATGPTTLKHEVCGNREGVAAISECPAIDGISFDPATRCSSVRRRRNS